MRWFGRDSFHEFLVDRELPLVRMLLFSTGFRLALLISFVVLFGVPLSMVKWIRSTPDGIRPVVKISLLDLAQSWSLHRSAVNSLEDGDIERGLRAWREAIGNNPGRAELCREYLEVLPEVDKRRSYRQTAVQNAFWLMKLTSTNMVDVELSARVFEHYGFERLTLYLVDNLTEEPTETLQKAELRALFLEGRVREFGLKWEALSKETAASPDLDLFRVTYLAGWGTPDEAKESMERLNRAMKNPETQLLAHRLNLFVCVSRLDPEAYKKSLDFLVRQNRDRPSQHLGFWTLLAELDRKSEAMEYASVYAIPPRSAIEAVQFAEAFVNLGMRDIAFQFLQRYSVDYSSSEGMWFAQAEILISQERWQELYFLAVSMREEAGISEVVMGFSYFLEGRAEFERGRDGLAQKAFRTIKRYSLEGSRVGIHIAANLFDWGYATEARDVLVGLEEVFQDQLVYWELLFEVAKELRSSRDLLLATENLYQLKPNDFATKNNYAAVLLSMRIRPEEAITLTFQALNQDSGNPSSKINHAHALLLNDRVDEAAALLDELNPGLLILPLRHGYYLAWLEIEFQRGRIDQVKRYGEMIDEQYLLPGDRLRYVEILQLVSG